MVRKKMNLTLGLGSGDLESNTSTSEIVNDSSENNEYVSHGGTFHGGEFHITGEGITTSKHQRANKLGTELKQNLVVNYDNPLGAGASGVVYLAIDKRDNSKIALKEISVFDEGRRKQILKELEAMYDSNHNHLVSFHGAFYSEGSISIAMEYMDVGAITDIMEVCGKIPETILSVITEQVLQGFYYLHKKRHLIHRDVKPNNILMNSKGEFKITDFGVSSELEDSKADCGTFVGTVMYMSPERLGGEKYSYESDIWSFGLTIMELATGRFPYNDDDDDNSEKKNKIRQYGFWELLTLINKNDPQLNPKEFSKEICNFISICLNKDRTKRPTAEFLLSHPFVTRARNYSKEYQQWVSIVTPMVQKLNAKKISENPEATSDLIAEALNGFTI